MTSTHTKVKISERALIQRINRKLKRQGELLRTARGMESELGRHYIVDVRRNFVTAKDVAIEVLGRRLEVLKPWEQLYQEYLY